MSRKACDDFGRRAEWPLVLLYEVVAACCISETESTAVLTTLRVPDGAPRVRSVLRDILRDEMAHNA